MLGVKFSLLVSLALHVGSFTLIDAYYGAAFSGKEQIARRQAPLSAVLIDVARPAFVNPVPASAISAVSDTPPATLPEGLAFLPGPYYFSPHELSRGPQAAAPVPLDYPESAPLVAKNHVVLRLLINEAGDVDKIIVETADVPMELEALARQAFARAKFKPGLRGEVPVKSQMQVEITFEGGDVPPSPGAIPPSR